MDLIDLLRDAIDDGRLEEPFTAGEAAFVVDRADWPLHRVQSYLVRYCQGNLAAGIVLFERAAYGHYRLLSDGPRKLRPTAGKRRGGVPRGRGDMPVDPQTGAHLASDMSRVVPNPPGDPDS